MPKSTSACNSILALIFNATTWAEQYARFFRGEIDDPWNAKNDTPELAAKRAELKKLMDEQQGRAFGDRIAQLKKDMAAADASTAEGRSRAEEIRRDGFPVMRERVSLTPVRKLWIAWRTWVFA